jgi:hypothetical protein
MPVYKNGTKRCEKCRALFEKQVFRSAKDKKTLLCHFLVDRKTKVLCMNVVCSPVTDRLCTEHHPLYKGSNVERLLLEAAKSGKDPTEVMKAAGYSAERAEKEIQKAAESPSHLAKLEKLMDEAGLDRADGLRALKRSLEAQRALVSRNGDIVGHEDDAKIQLEAAEIMLKLQGMAAPPQAQNTGVNLNLGIAIPMPQPMSPDTRVITLKKNEDE